MKISYSVVLYNNPLDQISTLIDNLLTTAPNIYDCEFYFVNNSPQNIKITNYLRVVAQTNSKVHLIVANRNKGFGSGHNLAISNIHSEYHIIVNPDITIPDDKQIEMMISYMENHDIVLLSPLIRYENGKVQKLVKHDPTVFDMAIRFLGENFLKKRQDWFNYSSAGYDYIHEASNFPGSFLVFNTGTLKSIHGFDERYFLYMEDSDISRSMSNKGKAVFSPNAYVLHEWQRNNRKTISGILQMINSMIKYFNKWGWKLW